MFYKLSIKDPYLEFNNKGKTIRTPIDIVIKDAEKTYWEFQLRSKGARHYSFEIYTEVQINKKTVKKPDINDIPNRPSQKGK